ncbi:hypothetical protein HZH68_009344 [Vespula germanica]|uniref:Uncharacterized protein n=1 Tax=Vespula germanica TaxID=30212 RepID=A0A834JYH8_VESGE|nr:hypothetical protein HZH68_009344 [Vespula germanica]
MKNKIKNKVTSNSISVAVRAKRFFEKASSALGRWYDELNRRGRIYDGKIDRQNRINEIKMKEAEDIGRFIDENTENELRELGTIDRSSIDSRSFGIIDRIGDYSSRNGETKNWIEDEEEDEDVERLLENFYYYINADYNSWFKALNGRYSAINSDEIRII